MDDRISSLNAQQILKELQNYKKYAGKSQNEIKQIVGGGVVELRKELKRLENKKALKPKPKIENNPIDNLNAQQILKELQNHKKYKGKTQNEIKQIVGGGVIELRKELKRLEKIYGVKEKVNDNVNTLIEDLTNLNLAEKLIYVKGKGYTENELEKMINHYINTK